MSASEAPIELGVLGPLRVAAGGTELEITSARSRAFLAALVVNARRQVTLYEFTEAMWGAEPPEKPRRAVQLCAARVRAQLERVGAGDVVVTCPNGYRLDGDAVVTDLGRVKAHVREADAADAANDTDGELAAVTAALAQWRGEPLADVASALLQREVVPGLVEQRLTLTERRIDILLRRGDASDVVDELVTLTARYPLRERLWGQLMRALHRRGRRGEALNAYHGFRHHLNSQLGIEPSEEIRALHTTILTTRADAEPAAAAVSLPVPRELPSDTAAFAGRAAELSRLDALVSTMDVSAGPVVGVVTGTAGVGKSTLAVHWARRVSEEFPDGQLFVNMRGYHADQALSPGRVLARFLRALGVRGEDVPDDVDERAAMYRSVMDGRRMLLLLDNVNSSDQVRPLLPSGEGCLALITSRDVLLSLIVTDGARRINLDLPSVNDARKMLARRLGGERLRVEPKAADDIIAASARLPLAIAIAAARAATCHDSRLSAVAAQLRRGLDAFDTASAVTDVRSVFSWSYRALSPEAARLLRLLGLHPGPDLGSAAAASLIGLPPKQGRPLLAELVRANLLTEHIPGRYALHDLMREYARELVGRDDDEPDRRAAATRLIDHYTHSAYAAEQRLNQARVLPTLLPPAAGSATVRPADHQESLEFLISEYPNLRPVIEWAHASGFDDHAWRLACLLCTFYNNQALHDEWRTIMDIALSSAARTGDDLAEARTLYETGRMAWFQRRFGDVGPAVDRAQELFAAHDDVLGMGLVESLRASLPGQSPEDTLERMRRSGELVRSAGHHHNAAIAILSVATLLAELGRHDEALAQCDEASAIFAELDDRHGRAVVQRIRGDIHAALGQHREAQRCYREVAEVYRSFGSRQAEAEVLAVLGDSHAATDEPELAADHYRRAAEIFEAIGHPDAAETRTRLSNFTGKPLTKGPCTPDEGLRVSSAPRRTRNPCATDSFNVCPP